MTEYVDIPLDTLDEEAENNICLLLEGWVRRNLDDAANDKFAEGASEIGIDVDEIANLVGHCVLNQLFTDALRTHLEESDNDFSEKD